MSNQNNIVTHGKELEDLRVHHRRTQWRWGFSWAMWCAILWGAWYLPGTTIFYEIPFVSLNETNSQAILSAFIVSMLNALAVVLAMLLWIIVVGKRQEFTATLKKTKVTLWFVPAGFFGLMAILGIYLAITFVGPAFGAVAGLLFPLAGIVIARLWYNERITLQRAIGIIIMLSGALMVFAPGLIDQIAHPGANNWIGYVGGVMTIIGFGGEGAVAGRALDVADSEVGALLRFLVEIGIWLLIMLPVMLIIWGSAVFGVIWQSLTNPYVLLWLTLMGLTYAFCYMSWYKSFPLVGVGPGQAIGTLSGPTSIILLWLFSTTVINWNVVVGCLIAVTGSFVLLVGNKDDKDSIRNVSKEETAV